MAHSYKNIPVPNPTNNPVPSADIRDHVFAGAKVDEFATSTELTYTDRFGVKRHTIEGINHLATQAISTFGYITMDSFEDGNSITLPNQVLRLKSTGEYYRWDGELPKFVQPGSTPSSTGGIGAGAWVSVGDASLRGQLSAPSGADLVSDGNGIKLTETTSTINPAMSIEQIKAGLDNGVSTIVRSIEITKPLSVPSYAHLSGTGMSIGMIGTTTTDIHRTIKKTGAATVSLSNVEMTTPVVVDCVLYQDPKWPSANTVYPQKSKISDISIQGNSPASPTQAGIYILQGGVMDIRNVDIINCRNAIHGKSIWLSTIEMVHAFGKMRFDDGTSLDIRECEVTGDLSSVGAYDLRNIQYSSLTCCASDNAVNTAYSFSNCRSVTLNGCGCENPNTQETETGTAIAFRDNNVMTINGFNCYPPIVDRGIALISVGSGNNITINGWNSSFGVAYDIDMYVAGDGSYVVFNEPLFSRSLPRILFKSGSTSKVLIRRGPHEYLYTAQAGGGVSLPEIRNSRGPWTPVLKIGGLSNGITQTSTGVIHKSTNMVTCTFDVTITSKGPNTGIVTIDGLPFVSPEAVSVGVAIYSGLTSVSNCSGIINAGTATISLLTSALAGITSVTDVNMTNTVSVKGSVTYNINTKFN